MPASNLYTVPRLIGRYAKLFSSAIPYTFTHGYISWYIPVYETHVLMSVDERELTLDNARVSKGLPIALAAMSVRQASNVPARVYSSAIAPID